MGGELCRHGQGLMWYFPSPCSRHPSSLPFNDLFQLSASATMILRKACWLFFILLSVHLVKAVHLRKHTHVVPAHNRKSEPSIVQAMQGLHQQQPSGTKAAPEENNKNALLLGSFTRGDACGHGTLTCIAFAHDQYKKIPVLCGVLQNAPVCQSAGATSDSNLCDAFCDSDGGARVCEFAFPTCCSHSPNGCISSEPRNVVVYNR
ncbi:hypothetical protein BX666DRAFT_61262 [Dichotomocladium elegans]|nr:hypothetical protein BX666DRAFT_61262 [Dichotomocladium elegans]